MMLTEACPAWELNDIIARNEVDEECLKGGLFGPDRLAVSVYTFLHIDVLSEDLLKEVVTCTHASLILDLRFRPLFEEPRFNHRHLIDYLSNIGVVYLDVVYYASSENERSELEKRYQQAFRDLGGVNFWSIFIFDNETVSSHLLDEFRSGFRNGAKIFKEVHPEVALGKRRWRSMCLDPHPKSY